MAEAPSEPIRVRCTCGVKLRAPAKAAGRRIKCPKCGTVLEVPAPEPLAVAPLDVSGGSDPGALLEELAAQAQAAPSESRTPAGDQSECPNCGQALAAEAKLCVACGFNLATGRTLKSAKTGPGPVAGAIGQAAGAAGRTGLGIVLSAVAALMGAAVWYAVAAGTGYELGWIAWGIGLLAGVGMLSGVGRASARGAVLAAVIAALGIVAGKLLVFNLVVAPVITGRTDDIETKRELLAVWLTEEQLEKQDLNEFEWDRVWDMVYPAAVQTVAEMPDEKVAELYGRYSQDLVEIEVTPGLFFSTMFDWFDVIFILLALGSAAKLAGSGLGGGED